ncbi:MAG: hypothetical protein EOO24_30985 [Comamonadaceae bacterium]|nr:MAG: hypothetical protein EOO24_30985 [Comamonadaceae bacterium]
MARLMLGTLQRAHTMTATIHPPEDRARLVRNLLALRMVLCMDEMETGKRDERIVELEEELASLGHDMKSTVACAADGLRRAFLLPRLINRRRRPLALAQD